MGARPTDRNLQLVNGSKMTPETANRVRDCARLIAKGKTRATILEYLQEHYGLARTSCPRYYQLALRYLDPEDCEGARKDIINKNTARLETIIEECMAAGDEKHLRLAKDAIAELNKLAGVGGSGVTIARDDKGQEIINVTFD